LTNERWLKWAVSRHFRRKGLTVRMTAVKVGNAAIDGEVEGQGWRMALEIKSTHDDIVRGLGQLVEALAHGYTSVALVTSLRNARRVKPDVFDRLGLVLLGVDSKGMVHQIYPTYASVPNSESLIRNGSRQSTSTAGQQWKD
jgi:hypothetical protein